MTNDERSPWLKSTARMLARAYPDERLPKSDYFALIKVLLNHASQRNVTDALSTFQGFNRGIAYNDVLGIDAGDTVVPSVDLERVLERLRGGGYEAWLLEQEQL